ncbi:hypothetical protein KUTeg_013871 [Tegillarca granosa]|uniref:Uncharacterized protein n=1 Tax=Tegillarca granosa TaxID=220873 RepID=A0ABQ9EZF2_TEGGR|nr:hypothetical protein KUTeg_013871 [Tegillarca granosa]
MYVLFMVKYSMSLMKVLCHASTDQPYHEERQELTEAQNMLWMPRNKRPERLRDSLKEVEELMIQFKVVQIKWRTRRLLQIVLNNLMVISFVICGHSGDLEKILIDKSLIGKLSSDNVSDAYLCDQFLITSFPDRPRLDYTYFTKRPPLGEAVKKLEKLSTWEPKVTQVDIPGPVGRRLERKVCVNSHRDRILVWWPTSSEEAWPWSPMATDRDRANIIILSVHGCLQPHRLFTMEQAMSTGSETTAQTCTYEIIQGKIQRISVTSIPLKSPVNCQCRNPKEDKLVLGCADGSVIPISIAWHPTGTVFFVAGARGDIQVYDMALSPVRIQLVSEDPSPHRVLQLGKFFKGPPTVLLLHLGVFSKERFSGLELIKEYIKHKQLDEAITLLGCMNWDLDGANCYAGLSSIVNHLLRMPLNATREGQLESALGTFYMPKHPLSEPIIMDYRDPISRLARRFFHHLLRYSRFDKAFLLAVDIGARDLFMDIHYMAMDKGETTLAEVAKRKAEQLDTESLDSFDGLEDDLLENGYNPHYPTPDHLPDFNEDELPPSRQHPWQHDHHSNHNDVSVQNGISGRRNQVHSYIELEADLIHDYTAALQIDDPPWTQRNEQRDEENEESDKPSSVKVIHFGIV